MKKIHYSVIITTVVLLTILACQIQLYADKPEIANAASMTIENSVDSKQLITQEQDTLGARLPLFSIFPFIGILLSIALFPLFALKFWHHHYPKISLLWAISFAIPFMLMYGHEGIHEILHIYIIDYIPFIILLWGLFTVSGGIYLEGTFKGSPLTNLIILFTGTILASIIGTTGSSMLLIRPILRSNAWRKHRVHTIVFFIFLVSNIGGSLTPIGDPPLFLGFLHGVPFFWTFKLLPHMSFVAGILFAVYYLMDSYYFKKENISPAVLTENKPFIIKGKINVLFLCGIIFAVLLSGLIKMGETSLFGIHQNIQNFIRDGIIIIMGLLSMRFTDKTIRENNEFSWEPIKEVAFLFAGIFMCIIPALAILKAGKHGALAFIINSIDTPFHYFWITGILSSFLDNAPTYLTYFNTSLGTFLPGLQESASVPVLISDQIIAGKNISYSAYLMAISAGAVFMGAMTYIGNAPNFMVKSIAEESGVKMPGFFGYMIKYSIPILLGILIVYSILFYK